MKHRLATLAVLALGASACTDRTPLAPESSSAPVAVASQANLTNSYSSGSPGITAWGPIYQYYGSSWPTSVCTTNPSVSLTDSRWGAGHAPSNFGTNAHPWQPGAAGVGFVADWINAWGNINSNGGPGYVSATNPGAHNWTKYETQVEGNGTFALRLLADNCSWIYLDAVLVGVQGASWDYNHLSYGVTLNGTHTLTFVIFDGGGLAGGMYTLETTTNPPPPLNNDLDGDGHPNDQDAFPLDPTRWLPADVTPPVVTPTVAGTLGANGWYTSDVNVSWAVTDGESTVTSKTGCDATTLATDSNGVTYTCSATSEGGTTTQSVTVKRDATNPVIGYAGNAGSYTVDQTVAISCSASDATSGLASNSCANVNGAAYAFGAGAHNYSASASDNAGNTNSASTTFNVNVTAGGICALIQRWVSNAGVANSMCVKTQHATWGALRDELSAQSGKKISAANAATLLSLLP